MLPRKEINKEKEEPKHTVGEYAKQDELTCTAG